MFLWVSCLLVDRLRWSCKPARLLKCHACALHGPSGQTRCVLRSGLCPLRFLVSGPSLLGPWLGPLRFWALGRACFFPFPGRGWPLALPASLLGHGPCLLLSVPGRGPVLGPMGHVSFCILYPSLRVPEGPRCGEGPMKIPTRSVLHGAQVQCATPWTMDV